MKKLDDDDVVLPALDRITEGDEAKRSGRLEPVRTDDSKLAPSPNDSAVKARTQYTSIPGKNFYHGGEKDAEGVAGEENDPFACGTKEDAFDADAVRQNVQANGGSDGDPFRRVAMKTEGEEMKPSGETRSDEVPPFGEAGGVDGATGAAAPEVVPDADGRAAREDAVLSLDRTITGKKEQAFSRLQDELERARQELKLKDEEVSRLTRIREDVERELEDLTASLFQEAHKMVREANEKQAAAEKSLTECQMKVEVLTAEVAALKTLVLTSTPSRPNPHLHPQIGKEEAAGVNLFNRKHRRSPSHFNLKYGRENSPPGSPVRDQRVALSDSSSCPIDVRELAEMDPNLQRDFLNWKETAKLDKTDPFIDRIYREDINLCLDFNNKELAEEVRKAIESRSIFVEAVTDKTKTFFPRKCALLETTRQCHYRMKLGDQDAWYSISQMCRNRIIAVCDFLNYLRYIELGLVKSTAHDMYWEIVRLRKEMVLARLGLSLSSSSS